LCEKRLAEDWRQAFGHPVLLIETFVVDPLRFRGMVYKAANFRYVGQTTGLSQNPSKAAAARSPKMVFAKPLKQNAQTLLSQPVLNPAYRIGDPKRQLTFNVRTVFDYF
jgi:hypothetical protein